jgi:hypothetical protein
VHAIISDLGSNFQKLLREMNITPTTPWFICAMAERTSICLTTHQIKAVRYSLFNYDFYYGNKIGQWDDIIIMYKRDKSFTIPFCPKLTDKHVHITGLTKMKVKYAMQILSYSVSATVLTHVLVLVPYLQLLQARLKLLAILTKYSTV